MAKKEYKGSLFNQKYFDGYSKHIVLDENMKKRVEFVYDGLYYRFDGSEGSWKKRKSLIAALTAGVLALLIFVMAWAKTLAPVTWLVLIQVLMLFSLLGLAVCACFRIGAPCRMTLYDYRMGVVSVKEFAVVALLFQTPLVIAVPWVLILAEGFGLTAVLSTLCQLLSAAGLVLIYRTVKSERFITEESDDMTKGIDITDDFPDGFGY